MAKLISVDKDDSTKGRVVLVAQFLGIPLTEDVVKAQAKAGCHPAEYGAPNNVKVLPTGKQGEYQATWTC